MIDRRVLRGSVSRLIQGLSFVAAVWLPQEARAADLPGPPSSLDFRLQFDQAKVAPQPIVESDKGPYLVTEVELNGHRLPALLDTGSEFTLVDSSVAQQVGLKPTETFNAGAWGGTIRVSVAEIDSLAVGAFTRKGGWIGVSDLGQVRQLVPQHFSVLLGADFLTQVAVETDRDSGSVTFLPSGVRPSDVFTTVPLGISEPGNHFVIPLRVNGHGIDVRIDTGADGELSLVNSKWPELVPTNAPTTDLAQVGAGGLYLETIAQLNSATIGNLPIGQSIADRIPDGGATRTDGVIGMGALSRLNFILDARGGTMAVARAQKPYAPADKTMVGIQGRATDQGLEVIHVMAHSPAQEAGLKDGDRICTVDGEQISPAWKGTPKGRWMLGPAGRVVTLGRCGGGSVEVTLRPFY
jgi:predicted aspartyl protease